MGETNRNQAGVRARTAAIEAGGGFDPGELAFEETAEARKACVDARAALLWDVADLSDLDQRSMSRCRTRPALRWTRPATAVRTC